VLVSSGFWAVLFVAAVDESSFLLVSVAKVGRGCRGGVRWVRVLVFGVDDVDLRTV
jgi:hypothetical protein